MRTQRKVLAAAEIGATFDRILSHAPFRRSPQPRAFLTYIVDVEPEHQGRGRHVLRQGFNVRAAMV
jgi:hypothetical protein